MSGLTDGAGTWNVGPETGLVPTVEGFAALVVMACLVGWACRVSCRAIIAAL